MQENNFEDQVRHKLDDLSLTPSEPVWLNVEAAIKKKRKRRLLFWLLPLFVAIGSVVWWQIATTPIEKQAELQATKPNKNTTETETFSKPHISQPAQNARTETAAATKQKEQGNEKPVTTPSTLKQTTVDTTISHFEKKKGDRKKTFKAGSISEDERNENAISERKPNRHANAFIQEKDSATLTKMPAAVTEDSSVQTAASKPATIPDTLAKTKEKSKDSVIQTQPLQTKANAPKHNWEWQFVSRAGTSNMSEKLFAGFGNKMMENAAGLYNSPASGGPSPTNDTDTSNFRVPSSPAKGLHFAIGFMAKKRIGKNSFLAAGLQYGFYRNHLSVGTQLSVDSIAGNQSNSFALTAQQAFNVNGIQNRFTNRMHFIELPVSFQYQLLKKLPLHIEHGIAVSRLVASRVLQYDSQTNRYYQKETGLRKTGVNVFTTIDYTVWKGKKVSIQAGPYLQYGLQPLVKAEPKTHLISGGFSTRVTF